MKLQRALPRPSPSDRLARLRQALPAPRTALFGALLWGLAVGAGAFFNVTHWANSRTAATIAALFALGAAVAFPAALFLARLVALHLEPGRRFAALFLALGLATVGITALVFAFQYRIYYAAWHAETFSYVWGLQLFFTTAGALYQYAVLGLRLYFPYGLAALFAFSLWFASRPR